MRLLLALALACTLSGCKTFDAKLALVNAKVNYYAPIVGRDVLMIANILVTAECSPLAGPTQQVTSNVLDIVAPNSKGAARVKAALATNQAVAAQLCPLVAAIKTSVGSVPTIAPSQVVLATSSAAKP